MRDGSWALAGVAFKRVLRRRVVAPPVLRNAKVAKRILRGTIRDVAAKRGLKATTTRA